MTAKYWLIIHLVPFVMLMTAAALPLIETEMERAQSTFAESPTVEEYVRSYFADAPIMAEIAKCESRFRHFDKHGYTIRGEINRYDVGVMQVNEKYHLKQARALGYNLHSLEGNVAYARYLYEKKGTQPWDSSARCWSKERLART